MHMNKTNQVKKAIIIAAGLGSRLGNLTNDKPKCLLEVAGKSLLQHQIDTLKSCGITNISVIKGYKKEKINYPGLKYYINDDYQNNNILNSLFYAEPEMSDAFITHYSDILYRKEVVERLLTSQGDISVVIDINWQDYYLGRTDHPIEEAEKVIFDANNQVVEIGKILVKEEVNWGEFIGMAKFTKRGAEIFKRHFHQAKKLYWGKPFQQASIFQKAYLTDMFQEMIDLGVLISCVIIAKGWIEIDTVQDFGRAEKMLHENTVV